MTRISSVFNLLKQVGFAVLVLGAIVEIRAQGACEVRGPYDRCEVFERIKERIATDPWVLKGDAGEGGLQDDIWDWQVHSKGEVTQEMIDLLRTLADDPEVDGRIRVSAVWALELSEPEEELDRMRHLSKTAPPSIAVPAAAQLVRWGHWDDGSETLLRFGSWQQLAYSADEMHAMPILVAASWDTTRTGLSRIHAASAMRTYGDTLTFFAVAEESSRNTCWKESHVKTSEILAAAWTRSDLRSNVPGTRQIHGCLSQD